MIENGQILAKEHQIAVSLEAWVYGVEREVTRMLIFRMSLRICLIDQSARVGIRICKMPYLALQAAFLPYA